MTKVDQVKENAKRILTPDMALDAFCADMLDEEKCAEFVLRIVHDDVARCPECKDQLLLTKQFAFWKGKQVKCSCGKKFTGSTGTFFYKRFSSYRQMYLLVLLIAIERFTIQQISDYTKINRKTVGEWVSFFKTVSSAEAV